MKRNVLAAFIGAATATEYTVQNTYINVPDLSKATNTITAKTKWKKRRRQR